MIVYRVYNENGGYTEYPEEPQGMDFQVIDKTPTPEEIEQANKLIVPESISQMKLRKQLILSGFSIASIDALIQSLPQPNRDLIYTMWEYAVVFDRHNPELNAMAEMLGVTQEQLDEIFINGNLL